MVLRQKQIYEDIGGVEHVIDWILAFDGQQDNVTGVVMTCNEVKSTALFRIA